MQTKGNVDRDAKCIITCRGHHRHGVEAGEHHRLRRHRLQVVLVALAQLGADLGLGAAHVLDGSLHGDDPLQVERVDVVYAGDGDLRVGLLHYPLYRVAAFADYASDEVVVRQDFQRNFAGRKRLRFSTNQRHLDDLDLPLIRVVGFLLHNL